MKGMDQKSKIRKFNNVDVSEMYKTGRKGVCTDYVLFNKIKRKYFNKIKLQIDELSDEVKNKLIFSRSKSLNKQKIYHILEYVDKFDVYELSKLLKKEYTLIQFIFKIYEIRREKAKQNSIKFRNKSQTKQQYFTLQAPLYIRINWQV